MNKENTIITNNISIVIGDYYWDYADILRSSVGINPSMYDQRIIPFMAIKMLCDNNILLFNFDFKNNFGIQNKKIIVELNKFRTTKDKFGYIVKNIDKFSSNSKLLTQNGRFNPSRENKAENLLKYFNHKKVFDMNGYIEELSNENLEKVLDIYVNKANFKGYPTDKYKDLYEETTARMKQFSGDLVGQHFTQKSIIHLMTKLNDKEIKNSKKIGIYDPTSGVGSMLIESYLYIKKNYKNKEIVIYGQEMHGQTWLLANIFMAIQGIENIIAYGNTLTEPFFTNGNNFKKEDFVFIISNPPFGVEWGHEEEKIKNDMNNENSNFNVIKDKKDKLILPRKSDGQFLFFSHIINILKGLKEKNISANAEIISSGSLSSTGNETSAENQYRKNMCDIGVLEGIIEQPNDMFVNTNLGTNIWVLSNTNLGKEKENITVLQTNNTKEKLFIKHPEPVDKMKVTYSEENINNIIKYFNKSEKHISNTVNLKDNGFMFNISNLIDKVENKIDINLLDSRKKVSNLIDSLSNKFKDIK